MKEERESVQLLQGRALMIEKGRTRWRRTILHLKRRSTIKNQIQAWAKKWMTRMHHGLRKTKYSKMGTVSPTKKTSLPKRKQYRTDKSTYTHAGIESKAVNSLSKMLKVKKSSRA